MFIQDGIPNIGIRIRTRIKNPNTKYHFSHLLRNFISGLLEAWKWFEHPIVGFQIRTANGKFNSIWVFNFQFHDKQNFVCRFAWFLLLSRRFCPFSFSFVVVCVFAAKFLFFVFFFSFSFCLVFFSLCSWELRAWVSFSCMNSWTVERYWKILHRRLCTLVCHFSYIVTYLAKNAPKHVDRFSESVLYNRAPVYSLYK